MEEQTEVAMSESVFWAAALSQMDMMRQRKGVSVKKVVQVSSSEF